MKPPPSTMEKLRRFANDIEMFGIREALRHGLAYLLSIPRDHFDRKYGVSTNAIVPPSNAQITDPVALRNAIAHVPITEATFRHILRRVEEKLNPALLTFVDLGCGRGRAVLLAAELPFIEVVGVEVSPIHFRIAEANVAAVVGRAGGPRRQPQLALRSNVRLCCNDVTQFDFPATDLLVYMFCPFRGEIMQNVLDRLASIQHATKRNIYVILCSLSWDEQIDRHTSYFKQYEFKVISRDRSWSLWECRHEQEGRNPMRVGLARNLDHSSP